MQIQFRDVLVKKKNALFEFCPNSTVMNVILRQALPAQRSDSELVEPMLTLTLYQGPRILVSIKEEHKKLFFGP